MNLTHTNCGGEVKKVSEKAIETVNKVIPNSLQILDTWQCQRCRNIWQKCGVEQVI